MYAIFPTLQKLTRLVAGRKAFAANAQGIGHSHTMGRAIGEASPRLIDWPEFIEIPLKFAACLWHNLLPTEDSLKRPVVQEELARLSLAVKQRKIEHRNGYLYHVPLIIWNIAPTNDLFSKKALAKYAQKTNRDIPPFLQSVVNDVPGE